MINKPRISNWIGGTYIAITILILALFTFSIIEVSMTADLLFLRSFFIILMVFVSLLMLTTTYWFYSTKYVIDNGMLTSWSPFAIIKIKIKDITKLERILIPVHFRVGASFYSGYFYVPGLGWTKSIITNLSDGVLITTKDKKHYLITPSNPDKFLKSLKKTALS